MRLSNRTTPPLFPTLIAVLVGCASAPPPPPIANRASVRVDREVSRGLYRFRVEGAAGYSQVEALDQAREAALLFAAQRKASDPAEKNAARNCVRDNYAIYETFGTPGQVFRRNLKTNVLEVGVYVDVKMDELERALGECGLAVAPSKAKEVGRPTLMVVARTEDCSESPSTPACQMENRVAEAGRAVDKAKEDVFAYQNQIVSAGCVDKEKVKSLVEAASASSGRTVRYSTGYRGFYRGYYHGHGSSASSASSARSYRSVTDQVRNSANCRAFVRGLEQREARLRKLEGRLDRIQDQQASAREKDAQGVVTVTKLNQYLVDARWRVVDADGVEDARRLRQAIGNVSGLAEDPVAQLAQLAGADIYVKFGVNEITAGGGYQVELDVKAYEVVSGDVLASRVEKSRRLADQDIASAITEAAGKAMPVVMEQIQGYWSDYVRDGARSKVILRGRFAASKRDVVRALDEVLMDVSGCSDGACTFDLGLATNQTIQGEFVVPPKSRSRLGLYLEDAFAGLGLGADVIVTNSALTMIRLF